VVLRKQLRRGEVLRFFGSLEPCVVAMEACGSAHYWGREIGRLGHEVRLIAPAYVKPFVRRGKNDAAKFILSGRPAGQPKGRGDLRGGAAALDAFRRGQERRTAGLGAGVPHPRPLGAPAHPGDQPCPCILGLALSSTFDGLALPGLGS
jgi:hypothetical protein